MEEQNKAQQFTSYTHPDDAEQWAKLREQSTVSIEGAEYVPSLISLYAHPATGRFRPVLVDGSCLDEGYGVYELVEVTEPREEKELEVKG